MSGKLNGEMMPMTPRGMRRAMLMRPGLDGRHQTLRLGAHRRGAIKTFRHQVDFKAGFRRDAARLTRDPGDQFLLIILEHARGLAQDGGAFFVGLRRPAWLRGARFGGSLAHIGGGGIADARDLGAGRRLQYVDEATGGAPPFAAEDASAPGIFDEKLSCRSIHCGLPPCAWPFAGRVLPKPDWRFVMF